MDVEPVYRPVLSPPSRVTVALVYDGVLAGMCRKMHIPDDSHYYEKFYFTPGDLVKRFADA